MRKFKVCVYAICKNEEQFVDRWVDSMKEADEIYVLDTGSSDNTVQKLKERNVNVIQKEITPWRFDVARNESMKLLPDDTDICVCTDLDEVFHKGWREKVEKEWEKGATKLKYRYTWSFDQYGNEGTVFWISKIHNLKDYVWINPVHEVITYKKNEGEKELFALGVQLDHYPDSKKPRSQYLPLLELSVKEDPNNDRNMHYLGREYMYYRKWDKCIKTLKKHLEMKNATWRDERCASMRYIAKAYNNLGDKNSAEAWYYKAIAEASYLREPWIEMAQFQLEKDNFYGGLFFALEGIKIQNRSLSYINEADNWGYKPYDILALSYYYLGNYQKAYENGKKALEYDKGNERLIKNIEFYKKKI